MKLQPASRKEIRRITLGTLVCDGILLIALFLLSLVGVGTFSLWPVLLGIFCGTVIAVLNFTILLPILFPHVVIYYLQFTGRLMPKEPEKPDESQPS